MERALVRIEGLEPIEELELILEDVLRGLREKGEVELAFKIIKALGLLDVIKKELKRRVGHQLPVQAQSMVGVALA